jgi:hypothetical protein
VSSRAERFGLGIALAVGVLVRAIPVIVAGSVVGDGGLFFGMVEDLRRSGLALPATTSYNALDIPFVYPPLALLGAAALGSAFGIATLDVLRWLPMVLSVLCLTAFAVLAARVLSPRAAIGATFAYSLMPSAYGWLVAGGGLTRGAGLLFALLAAALVVARAETPALSPFRAVAAGILLGAAGLSHPQAAVFGVLACLVLSWRRPIGSWLPSVAIAALSMLAVLLPWLAWVGLTHGPDSLVSAASRLEPLIGIIRLLNLRFSAAPFMDLVGVAGVLGLVVTIARRQPRLPTLLLITYVAGAGGGEFLAAVPWAIMAGIGLDAMIAIATAALSNAAAKVARRTGVAVASGALFLALIGALGSPADQSSKLHPLSQDQITAMQWLRDNTPSDSRVIVPTDEEWGYDEVSEWIPALSGRQSVGTVQGSEWLGADKFARQLGVHRALRGCAGTAADCYRSLYPDAIIYVPKGKLAGLFSADDCCPAVRFTLEESGYLILYDGAGATIGAPASMIGD